MLKLADFDLALGLDFEAYFDKDFSLEKLSTTEYVRHSLFQILGASLWLNGEKFWVTEQQLRDTLADLDASGRAVALVCHHSHFDGLILSEKFNWRPAFHIDTLGMARQVHGPFERNDLDSLAKRELGEGKLKSSDFFKGIRLEDMSPELWNEVGEYAMVDIDRTVRIAEKYLARLTPRELRLNDIYIRMFTEPLLHLDEAMLRELHEEELTRRANLLKKLGLVDMKPLRGAKCPDLFRQLGIEVEMKVGTPKKIKHSDGVIELQPRWIPALAKSDPFMQGLLEHDDPEVRTLAEARIAAKSVLNVTRAARMLNISAGHKPVPIYYKVSAAHTHRIGGGDGSNFANLERVSPRDPKRGRIRKAIMAPAGYVIVVRDSSQIEARFVSWWAGAIRLVDAFAAGRDIYSEQASLYYHRTVNRKNKIAEDIEAGNVGKTLVLGGGYGMGWAKAAGEFLRGVMGSPPIQFTRADIEKLGIEWFMRDFLSYQPNVDRMRTIPTRLNEEDMMYHCVVSAYFVTQYREVNRQIPQLWKYLNDDVIPRIAAGESFFVGPVGNPELFEVSNHKIILPGGSVMHYPDLRRDKDGWTYHTAQGRVKLYGGKLSENLTQAACGVIVMDQMIEVVDAGWPVKLMTYDELASVARTDEATRCLTEMGEIMKRTPSWAPGLPLASDGGFAIRYGEAKE